MNHSEIKYRLYRAILILGAVFALISIVGNWFSSFPFRTDIKWIALLLITVVALLFSNNKKYSHHIMFGVFVFLVFIFLPFAFADSGGSNNNATGYTFLLLISITYLFDGKRRVILIAALILAFMGMHALEYFRPDLIAVYPSWNQYLDRMIQIPLLLFASFFIILQFSKEYEAVNRKLQQYASLDELTGLYNRRMFNQAMEAAVKEPLEPIYLALLDLDNFKNENDTYGHGQGDLVLKELALLMREAFGSERHIVSRWGGDEFAVIYYGAKKDLIRKLDEIESGFLRYVSSYEEPTGISRSIVSFCDYDSVAQTLNAADEQLYSEKQNKQP